MRNISIDLGDLLIKIATVALIGFIVWLFIAQTLHRTYSIIDLDDGEETITVGDHAH